MAARQRLTETPGGNAAHDQQDRPVDGRCHGRHQGRLHGADRRLRRGRPAERADRGADRARRHRPDRRCQQRGRRPCRAGAPDGTWPRAEDHLLVPAFVGPSGVRDAIPRRQDRTGDRAAGHARRTHACGGRRRARVLHRHRRWHQDGHGQADPGVRRPQLRDGARTAGRCGVGGSVGRGPLGQPDVQGVGPQLQSGDRDGGTAHHRADPAPPRTGEIDPDHVVTPGIFVDRVLHVPYGDPTGF